MTRSMNTDHDLRIMIDEVGDWINVFLQPLMPLDADTAVIRVFYNHEVTSGFNVLLSRVDTVPLFENAVSAQTFAVPFTDVVMVKVDLLQMKSRRELRLDATSVKTE